MEVDSRNRGMAYWEACLGDIDIRLLRRYNLLLQTLRVIHFHQHSTTACQVAASMEESLNLNFLLWMLLIPIGGKLGATI